MFPNRHYLQYSIQMTLLGIFYTSGSTGEPKGVLRTHGSVLNRLAVDLHDQEIGTGDRLLYMRQFNVCASLGYIFNALVNRGFFDTI